MSRKSLYLINPGSDFPTYFSAEVCAYWGFRPTIAMADLAVTTVAALAPPELDIRICDEAVEPVDFDTPADFIAITGKNSQRLRMKALAARFRDRGKTVIIGGPYASLVPEAFRDHCDILVRGEIENLAASFFGDLLAGTWRDEYVGDRPDLTRSPAPRWDLYPHDHALMGSLQTSRGCPFSCEFCDVIQYLGRSQRHKTPAQVVTELDQLYRLGFRRVFVADDNFTASRSKAKELLEAFQLWNARQVDGHVVFDTQLSIDAAKDESLLGLLADAGFHSVFIGIETPNVESLRETRKYQNLNTDLAERTLQFVRRGIGVTGGLIVGFDGDGRDIFDRQYEFAMSTAIPIFSLGVLYAPEATPLHERLAREGRLVDRDDALAVAGSPWDTNVIPRQLSRDELIDGVGRLVRRLYEPAAFGERLLRFIAELGPRSLQSGRPHTGPASPRRVDMDTLMLLSRLPSLGPMERDLFRRVSAAVSKKPVAKDIVFVMLGQYLQVRMMMERHLPAHSAA